MSTVVKFPKAKRAAPEEGADADAIRVAATRGSALKGVFAWLWLVVRLPVFLLMYWLRLPVIFLCNLVSFPMLMAWLFALYAFPDKHLMIWAFGTVSFGAFLIAWTYDFILMAISPQDIVKAL